MVIAISKFTPYDTIEVHTSAVYVSSEDISFKSSRSNKNRVRVRSLTSKLKLPILISERPRQRF